MSQGPRLLRKMHAEDVGTMVVCRCSASRRCGMTIRHSRTFSALVSTARSFRLTDYIFPDGPANRLQ